MVQWHEPGHVELEVSEPLTLTAAQASWFAELIQTASVLSESPAPRAPVAQESRP